MAAKNVLGLIFSNAYDESVPELTAMRTMGSVPFAGRYRLIDFPLSGMVNAGITQVGVFTNSNYHSLMDHIGNGSVWDLDRKREGLTLLPPFSNRESGMSDGKVSSLYGNIGYISDSAKDYVLLTDCNIISKIDYEDMLKFSIEKNADVVEAYAEMIPSHLSKSTSFIIDENGRITETNFVDSYDKKLNTSVNVILLRRTLLERLLHEANSKRISDMETHFAKNLANLRVFGYKVEGYVKAIESVISYYEASLDLLKPEVRNYLFSDDSPIYTKTGDRTPSKYGINAKVKESLVADGCRIYGEVENCILFRGVTVAKGAKVKNSIIMQDTEIGENAKIECVITDKDVKISSRKTLCGAENYPIYIGKGIVI